MKEDFLHHIWLYKKIDFSNLKTTQGDTLTILDFGQYTQQSGPDFFNAQLILNHQKWAGNIEIHIKSSDWYVHHHERDPSYDNVILHVVWQHDTPIYRSDNTEIPVLELQYYVTPNELQKYQELVTPKTWIFCENQLATIGDFVISNWQERLFFERLERKATFIWQLLRETENDWEAVLFIMLAKNFGLNTNGESFFKIAQSIPFAVIRKEALEAKYLEALLFGQGQMIPKETEEYYPNELRSWYEYLMLKYQLTAPVVARLTFFKHRPDNFPTIRIAQLAMVYQTQQNLFSAIIEMKTPAQMYSLFACGVSDYWKTHYNFDKTSPSKEKVLSKSFINLLLINTIIPIRFAYARSLGNDNAESLIDFLLNIPPEQNNIIEKFSSFGLKSKNAFQTQALLQLKNDYCTTKKCLHCAIGLELLKDNYS